MVVLVIYILGGTKGFVLVYCLVKLDSDWDITLLRWLGIGKGE